MNTNPDIYVPAGESGHDQYEVDITQQRAGWTWSSIKVVKLDAGGELSYDTGDDEILVLPLNGGCTIEVDGQTRELVGRPSVFEAISDFCYIPRHTTVKI